MRLHFPHHLNLVPDLLLLFLSVTLQALITRELLRKPAWKSTTRRVLLALANLGCAFLSVTAYLLSFNLTWKFVPATLATWVQATGMLQVAAWSSVLLGLWVNRRLDPRLPVLDVPRRQFLQTAGTALAVAPLGVAGFGIVARNQFELLESRIAIPNLPKDLDGLRLVQISDIHLSAFLSAREFSRAVAMANETKAHVALVTGDLITRLGDPLDACLLELAKLRGEAGVLGCLGNHEIYANCESYVTEQGRKIGIDFLRMRSRSLRFGNSRINFAGVDYQKFHEHYLVGAEELIAPGQLNVLLSHNPDVFPVAARQGFDLTLAGHTHGGQVNFEILHKNVNVARMFTPFTRGLYQRGAASIYVSSGLGTIGVPLRMGAPSEVSLITLCAS